MSVLARRRTNFHLFTTRQDWYGKTMESLSELVSTPTMRGFVLKRRAERQMGVSSWAELAGLPISNPFEENWAKLPGNPRCRGWLVATWTLLSLVTGKEPYRQGSISSPLEDGSSFCEVRHRTRRIVSCLASWDTGRGRPQRERAMLRRFLKNANPTVAPRWEATWTFLKFRSSTQIQVERLLRLVDVPRPFDCQDILACNCRGARPKSPTPKL